MTMLHHYSLGLCIYIAYCCIAELPATKNSLDIILVAQKCHHGAQLMRLMLEQTIFTLT